MRTYYDLEPRTLNFAKKIRSFISRIPKSISTIEDGKQLIRSSGSVGANYIEANEAISKKDFIHRIKICRKEAKESQYWLKLIILSPSLKEEADQLLQESIELTKIFGSMIEKFKISNKD